jgi:hypothetical protein
MSFFCDELLEEGCKVGGEGLLAGFGHGKGIDVLLLLEEQQLGERQLP